MAMYEKAERAKTLLMELLAQIEAEGKTVKEISQLETIIAKIEVWQCKYSF